MTQVSSVRPLADAKRQAAIDHVLQVSRKYLVEHGLEATTMDRLAEQTGVSRRTLFRLFETRERLLAEALDAGRIHYANALPRFDGNLDRWLRETCETAHRLNSSYGPGLWELASRQDLPPGFAAIERTRRRERRAAMTEVANTAWRAAGGDGAAPATFVAVVGANLSAFFTAAVTTDVGGDWKTAAALAYDAIQAALRNMLAPNPPGAESRRSDQDA